VRAPDLVAVGHVTLDRFEGEVRPGGAALYAAVTASRLGLEAAILTSHGADFPLETIPPRIEVVSVPAPATTAFEHADGAGGRVLRARAAAGHLGPADVPPDWRDAPLVLLAPVLDEVDAGLAAHFEDATVAAAAQGWLRSLGPGGEVGGRPWSVADVVLSRLQALFLSTEDASGEEAALVRAFQRVPVAALTAGALGGLLFVNGERYEMRPRRAREVDATGAGDVFAAAFLVHYRAHGDPWQAAEAATCAASLSVEGVGWSAVPDTARLEEALAVYRRDDLRR
jgi:1D-myo-inositol 3-kinase